MFSRILIVDDDDLQQSILRAAFEKKGFSVDTASDGLEALKMLRSGKYDLALIDYLIPEIDGLASARLLRDLMDEGSRPKLIAVTADSEGLALRDSSAEAFDAIVPKQTDLPSLMRIVEAHLIRPDEIRKNAEKTWRGMGLPGIPSALVIPAISREQELALRPFFDLSGTKESDLVLVANVRCEEEAAILRESSESCRIPFVDLTGNLKSQCDVDFSAGDMSSWMRTARAIMAFSGRKRRTVASASFGPERLLLEYLYVSERRLDPVPAPDVKRCFRYPGLFREDNVTQYADNLFSMGLLAKKFVDRTNSCTKCGSRRLNAREECPSCRSPNIHESVLIHHFKCAYQGSEDSFSSGRDLVCPKCRQHLRHYGSDYDKPGIIFKCDNCEKSNALPAVGFNCLDCGNHMDGEAVLKEDVFSYEMTEKSENLLEGKVSLGNQTRPLISSNTNNEYNYRVSENPFIDIEYKKRKNIIDKFGSNYFERIRKIFIDNLKSIIPVGYNVVRNGENDSIIIDNADNKDNFLINESILESCQEHLAENIDPKFHNSWNKKNE